jgi:quinoprotein relay system zinc metallohydrolase 2
MLIGAGLALAGSPLIAGKPKAAAEPVMLVKAGPGVFVHQGAHEVMRPSNLGHIANVGCIIGEDAVAVVDSGGSAAHGRLLRSAIREVTDLPIRYVIATHVHPDHLFGHAAFLDDKPTFVGHAKLPAALQARGTFYLDNLRDEFGDLADGTDVVMPDLLVEDVMELDLGNRRLLLTAHPTAHTDNDLSILDHESGLLWAGDLVFMERLPVVDGHLLGWLDVLERMREEVKAAAVIPGHGPITAAWPRAMDAEVRYLSRLRDDVRAFLAAGGLLEDAVQAIGLEDERSEWSLFDHYHGRNVSAAFAELEWE